MKNINIDNLISRLAAEEAAFLKARFLAPVARQGSVQVRIAGIICTMRVRPASFTGWGVFAPTSYVSAMLQREATLGERRKYLALFPAVRLILTDRQSETVCFAQSARLNDARFRIEGNAVVHSIDEGEQFDTIIARFDGGQFWFDETDPQADPSHGTYLRESIIRMLDPRRLDRPGLTPEQRLAYAWVHAQRLREQLERLRETSEYRLRSAIEHAGATMRAFSELRDVYRVTYSIDGRVHTSVVQKDNLGVQSAGVCLSGEDAKFDLTSLVSILREGHRRGIHHGLEV